MKRHIGIFLVAVIAVLACATHYREMSLGRIDLSSDAGIGNPRFPEVFLHDDEFRQEAYNCAAFYNDSWIENGKCTTWNAIANSTAVAGIITTGVATGLASQVESDAARRHYSMVALSAGAVTTGILAFDAWLNCRERAVTDYNIAHSRLAALQDAAHLLSCARQQEARMRPRRAPDGGPDAGAALARESADAGAGEIAAACELDDTLLNPQRLRDLAHAALLRCLQGTATAYGTAPTATSTSQH